MVRAPAWHLVVVCLLFFFVFCFMFVFAVVIFGVAKTCVIFIHAILSAYYMFAVLLGYVIIII